MKNVLRVDKLTPTQEKAIPAYRDKWIAQGLKTGETDWNTFDKYMPICYEKAGLKYPKNVVRVNSPLVGSLAASIAEAILRKKRGAVDDAVRGAVGGAVRDAVDGAVGGAVRDAVDGAVDGAVRGAVDDAVRGAVGGAVRDAVDGAVGDAVDDAVDGAVDGAVDDAVRGAVGGAVRDAVDGAVGDAVDDAVDGAVDGAVDDAVRGAVGGAVRDAVDGAVGDAVDDAVDGAVDGAVRDAVGGAVRGAVRGAVQTAISIAKKAEVSLSWHYWLGGQFWVGGWYYWGVAFANFFFDICKLKLSKDIMERALAYRKVCESVNYIWPNSDFVMVCARPIRISRDERGRLHSIINKAIEWPDGYGLYMIHGVKFTEEQFKKSLNASISDILGWEDIDQRSALLSDRPIEELLKKVKKILIDETKECGGYKLYEIEIDKIGKARFLSYKSWSSDKTYAKFVPLTSEKCLETVASLRHQTVEELSNSLKS